MAQLNSKHWFSIKISYSQNLQIVGSAETRYRGKTGKKPAKFMFRDWWIKSFFLLFNGEASIHSLLTGVIESNFNPNMSEFFEGSFFLVVVGSKGSEKQKKLEFYHLFRRYIL